MFVHGGSAHSGWWNHIAPFFASTHRVVSLDLSGHGDSDVRTKYQMDLWADEVIAAIDAGGISGRPYVVGHSMGGWIAATIGTRHGDRVGGLVIIDSPLVREISEASLAGPLRRTPRVYARKSEISERFRPEPAQDSLAPYIVGHIAEESVRQTEAGWIWKFDQEMLRKRHKAGGLREAHGIVPNLRLPTVYIRCELGMVTPEMAADLDDLFSHHAIVIELAKAGHHPMMDQPLSLVATLRAVLALWNR